MVKTSPFSAAVAGLIPNQGAKIPHASQSKNQNVEQSNIVTNSVKTFKMVHIQKKKILKKKRVTGLEKGQGEKNMGGLTL